ncbi:BTAD domain-containing putative transcriptional regulator [Actinoplanes sp. Pm04-4]|uniref:BTAD domain-containing putative transcriptional regulator n=1 Tax=Paractinoplanes pyxinae TaxID=2997416 RepID=A0ABT4B7N5_9ACTN|nr:BTAD domain-containing putative transcriptional regulator [Actinoplanes pyxinae]MCY1142047.1 BTAD domain-containing putative transcriptional regulator [Actinoplanes pyxinae]
MEIAVLGPLELRGPAGEVVPVAGARLRALLVLLALEPNKVVSAQRLIDGVWGDEPPSGAGNALQALVSRLRKAGLVIEAAAYGYRLVIEPEQVDAHVFTRLAATDPARALSLWRGDLDFPEVARADAARLHELRLDATKRGLSGSEAVPTLEGLVTQHPLDEQLAGQLMRALRAAGNPGRALEVYEQARRRLADVLGADPSAELRELHLELLREERRSGNLPAEVSSFVGREADVKGVRGLLGEHRLVSLIGPGGSGKTRLSVEVGRRLDTDVWRVELAPVTDPAEVPQAVLTALGLRGQGILDRPKRSEMARLREALAHRTMLLILDNCEHLITAAAQVADELLRAAPGLRVLATSREPLGIPGERLHPVEPLALPPVGAGASTASAFPSVRLLLDRAAAFTLTEQNTEAVVRVCRELDGMPLAIELAAARLRTLPVAVLADRLSDRFRLLTGGSRAALPRHQTLRAVVDWSWDLLTEPERQLWRRFALFQGGAEPAAAEQVCGTDIEVLAALVDKSLLVLGGDGRYRMLETIREYGLERLAEAGESESQRRALAAWLIELAGQADPQLRGADQLAWLRQLATEHDNLHASVRAAIKAGDRATAAALVARLGWYWWLSGHRSEGAALAAEVASMSGDTDPEDRALTHTYAAINGLEGGLAVDHVQEQFRLAQEHSAGLGSKHPALRLIPPLAVMFEDPSGPEAGFRLVEPLFDDPEPWLRAVAKMFVSQLRLNFGQSAELAEAEMREALAEFREIGERWGIGFALSLLGDLAAARGDFATAVDWQREAIDLVREVGVREDLPQMEVRLAHQLWMAGEVDEARTVLKQARVAAEQVALPEVLASVAYGHATFARMEGDLEEARLGMDAALARMRHPAVVPQFKAMALHTQGLISAAAGDLAAARLKHADAVRTAVESRDSPVVALTLVGLADLTLREGDAERAAFLLGAADAVRGYRDRAVPDVDRIMVEARAALGDAGFEEAYRRATGTRVADAVGLL